MRLKRADRPQSTAEFLALLESRAPDDATVIDTRPPVPKPKPKPAPAPVPEPEPKFKWKAKYTYALLAVVLVAAVFILRDRGSGGGGPGDEGVILSSALMASTGSSAGHEWVDLGLSVKWATCNVGASSPEGYGDYYAWGETSTKSSYDEDSCATWDKQIGDIAGTSRDVARVKWGGSWRMPTWAEFAELLGECTRTWTTRNGVNGCEVTGPNGNSIFVPAAGYRPGTPLCYAGRWGYYWGSTPHEDITRISYGLDFNSGDRDGHMDDRVGGRTVRPVTK